MSDAVNQFRQGSNSAYWKWQLAGWGSYSVLYTSVDALKQVSGSTPFFVFALAALLIVMAGIILSHVMRNIIVYWGLMKLRLRYQVVFLFGLTFVFTGLFWILFTVSIYTVNGAGQLIPAIFTSIFRLETSGIRGMVSQCLNFSVAFIVWNLSYALIHYDRRNREADWQKLIREKEMVELEARALRAQMNPHFVFNCMNSIKSLIQDGQPDKAVQYLTTFSKLIRNLFSQSDKNEITLYDEIETCRHYLQLEAMRFDAGFVYSIEIDEHIDLKSVFIPALIIQPFIENAIWHGLVPRGGGGELIIKVQLKGRNIDIVIDDNGIGREASRLHKSRLNAVHQSKGINLTQSRLLLDNILQKRKAGLQYTDKRDSQGKSAGTKVVISIIAEE
jgi:sensor histidine kinase YesM